MIKRVHLLTGHSGRDAVYFFIKNNYNLNVKRDEILRVIQKCDVCIKFTDNKKVKLSESENFGLFEKIGVDCIGPLPKSTSGKYHIILATDYASGYVEGIAVKKKTGPVVANFLMKQL